MYSVIRQGKALFIANTVAAVAFFFRWRLLRFGCVLVCDNRQHARRCFCRAHVNRDDLSLGDIALDGPCISATRHFEFDRVLRRACHFQWTIDAVASGTQNVRVRYHHAIAATVLSARTIARFASSILKPLCLYALAGASSASAAARNIS